MAQNELRTIKDKQYPISFKMSVYSTNRKTMIKQEHEFWVELFEQARDWSKRKLHCSSLARIWVSQSLVAEDWTVPTNDFINSPKHSKHAALIVCSWYFRLSQKIWMSKQRFSNISTSFFYWVTFLLETFCQALLNEQRFMDNNVKWCNLIYGHAEFWKLEGCN